MIIMKTTKDRLGIIVKEGDHIRLSSINWEGIKDLSIDEQRDLKTMVGKVFLIDEIDTDGRAWITEWLDIDNNKKRSHSLALTSNEFEKV